MKGKTICKTLGLVLLALLILLTDRPAFRVRLPELPLRHVQRLYLVRQKAVLHPPSNHFDAA